MRDTGSTVKSSSEYLELMEKGVVDFELEMAVIAYIFKKNLKFYYVKTSNQGYEGISSPSQVIGEISLNYDFSPEINILRLIFRSEAVSLPNSKKVRIDIICNEFENEILYKRAYPNGNASAGQAPPQTRHKRGYSMEATGSSPQKSFLG